MSTPSAILDLAFERIIDNLTQSVDCISFMRHFLHLFHQLRMNFLEIYQKFVLDEPESAVSQALKEAFLALRQTAESGKGDVEE